MKKSILSASLVVCLFAGSSVFAGRMWYYNEITVGGQPIIAGNTAIGMRSDDTWPVVGYAGTEDGAAAMLPGTWVKTSANFGGQFRRHTLVRIDFQNPIARARIETSMAARAFYIPTALDQSVGVFRGNGLGTVGAFIQHHHQFVGKIQRRQTGVEIVFFVMRHHQRAEFKRGGLGHDTSFHSSRAATSA